MFELCFTAECSPALSHFLASHLLEQWASDCFVPGPLELMEGLEHRPGLCGTSTHWGPVNSREAAQTPGSWARKGALGALPLP